MPYRINNILKASAPQPVVRASSIPFIRRPKEFLTSFKDEIYLITPQFYRNRSQSLIMMKPSRFLMELTADLMEPMELEEGLPHLQGGITPQALPEA